MRRVRAGLAAAALIVWAAAAFSAEASRAGMVLVPAGSYTPFLRLKAPNASAPEPPSVVAVGAFRLDVEPVTNAEFLDFVTAHPEWRRSRIKPLFADGRYLRRWSGDLALADGQARDEPVTNVSWFAAEAYCRARGARLPTTAQWEYALADEGRDRDALRERSLEWFAEPNPARPPAIGGGRANGFGVRDLVGLVWEWTLDFAAYATAAESRDPNGKDSALVCGGAAAGATDPTDYPGFMRFSMRASLKANYTADNVGFRCAAGAS
jgi:formylglycine-generating enzyme required for sulfatase activity